MKLYDSLDLMLLNIFSPLPAQLVVPFILELLYIMWGMIEAGFCHGDLKPGNLVADVGVREPLLLL